MPRKIVNKDIGKAEFIQVSVKYLAVKYHPDTTSARKQRGKQPGCNIH